VSRADADCDHPTACAECGHTTKLPAIRLIVGGVNLSDLFLSGRARMPLGGRSSALGLEAARVSVIAIS
jgi:hypothetical protein